MISAKPAYQRTKWSEGLKQRVILRTIDRREIGNAISMLNAVTNYWVVVVLGAGSIAQPLVYDCKPAAIEHLIAIVPEDFYIGDKKYQWMVYFNVSQAENTVTLIKAGQVLTPFDALNQPNRLNSPCELIRRIASDR